MASDPHKTSFCWYVNDVGRTKVEIVRTRTHKVCGGCNIDKPLSAFGKSSLTGDGRRTRCKQCRKEKEQEYHAERSRKQYITGRARIDAHKIGPCKDCGKSYPPCVMQFHHRDPAEKHRSVSKMHSYAQERLEAEISKCDLLCANCHMLRTYGKVIDEQ